ncbi:hypothetical protein Hte_008404 [Hypoxylon texense]
MADKPHPSPAQPPMGDNAPPPQYEDVTVGKQQQIVPVIQEENPNLRDLNASGPSAPKDVPKETPKDTSKKSMKDTPKGDKKPQASAGSNVRVVMPLHLLTEDPAWINCPFCRHRTKTRTTRQGTSTQTLAGAVLCIFCICLACVPCAAGWCENVHIFCSSCNTRVATIPHDGPIQVVPVA